MNEQNLKPDGAYGLYHFVMEELENVMITYDESHIEHDGIYYHVAEILCCLNHYTEEGAGAEIEVSCIFDELLHMDLGIFDKCLRQAAIVYSVFLAYYSNTTYPQLNFAWGDVLGGE